ncbi:MAG: NYN domain-containing protein [Deltaproteobacteria bacterium]|nr:NYN domain-containing protein [Deltaproteobacteria bacterium]
MSTTTPKFKSSEFKDALTALKEVFDAHSLGIVLLDALERKSAEQIVHKNTRGGGGPRLSDAPKPTLCGQITGWFFASDEVAYQVMKELDRACQKERHIVGSIPEGQAADRVGSYRAIALKRERAKLVWALARDERPSVRVLANRVINEFFKEVADLEKARAVTSGEAPPSSEEDVELARRLQAQAQRLADATSEVSDLQSKVDRFDEDRARLLAEIGIKERALRQATEVSEEREHELKRLRSQLADVEDKQREAEQARAAEREARATAEELAQRVRRLEKLASAAESLSAAQAELAQSERRAEELAQKMARTEQAYRREREDLDRERARLRADLEATREELHRARKRVAELESGHPSTAAASSGDGGCVILLDQANLAATAHVAHRRKVDFSALLERLRAGRSVAKAIAFVVDNGGTAFDAFCETLRRSGWELRIKKPKRFADGSSKADWDMGLAIEAIEQGDRGDTVILVSGDGDFAPLVRHLKRRGKAVEVASFPEGLAGELAQAADRVVTLDASLLE